MGVYRCFKNGIVYKYNRNVCNTGQNRVYFRIMETALSIAAKLVSIPSVNPMGKPLHGERYAEKNIALYIQQFLHNLGISSELFGEDKNRPNLVAYLHAGQPNTVMLEAHMDTVSEENMVIDPFDPLVKNGALYGRGSCDTKASLATYLHAIQTIILNKIPLQHNVVLAFVKDEEYRFTGAQELMAKGVRADFAIIGEPTQCNLIYAHKGLCRFFLHTHGVSCHSSMPWNGSNAILKMGAVLDGISQYATSLQQHVHPSLGHATVNVGRIVGGQTVNTVPALCSLELDNRLLPGMDFETIKSGLTAHLKAAEFTIDAPYLLAMGVDNPPDAPHCKALIHACESTGFHPQLQTAHYATDAAVYQHAGIPCVVFGPGAIEQAHTADEHIAVQQIDQAAGIILRLLTG